MNRKCLSAFVALLMVVAMATITHAVPAPLPIPSPGIQGWPSCSELMIQNNQFVPAPPDRNNCDENDGYGGCNGIIGDLLPDGTVINGSLEHVHTEPMCSGSNLRGCDNVYPTTFANMDVFTQCFCATVGISVIVNGEPSILPPGTGIQTLWTNVQACQMSYPDGTECDPLGCHWAIPVWNGCNTPGCCAPAEAIHSNPFDCKPLLCGDGIKQPWEQCDDGNRVDGDSCSATCTPDRPIDHPCDHACLSRLTLKDARPDMFEFHAGIQPATAIDPVTEIFKVNFTNAGGTILAITLPPGSFKKLGTRYVYRTSTLRVNVIPRPDHPGKYRVDIKGKVNLVGITLAGPNPMKLQIIIGDDSFSVEKVWTSTPKGWQTQFIP